MMLKAIEKPIKTLIPNERGEKMDITLTNDYYLQYNEKYFLAYRNPKKDVKNNAVPVTDRKILLLGRKLFKSITRTVGDIAIVALLLVICKYTGIYDLWLQLVEKLI